MKFHSQWIQAYYFCLTKEPKNSKRNSKARELVREEEELDLIRILAPMDKEPLERWEMVIFFVKNIRMMVVNKVNK